MVIPRLIQQALQDEPLTVFGNGCQTRCFVHVTDATKAILQLLDDPTAVGETFNVGSSEEISILNLAKLVITLCNSQSGIKLVPYDQAYESGFEDMDRRVPDTAKLRSRTGWQPHHSLDDILQEMMRRCGRRVCEGRRPTDSVTTSTGRAIGSNPIASQISLARAAAFSSLWLSQKHLNRTRGVGVRSKSNPSPLSRFLAHLC